MHVYLLLHTWGGLFNFVFVDAGPLGEQLQCILTCFCTHGAASWMLLLRALSIWGNIFDDFLRSRSLRGNSFDHFLIRGASRE